MAAKEEVRVSFDDRGDAGQVATITVDYAAKINILNTPLIEQFIAVIDSLAGVRDLRVVVLTGAGGRAFIGGADIREMAALEPESARAFITRLHRVCVGLRTLPVPVLARIRGYCLGAGLEIAAACDLRVAADDAVFGMPEIKVGIPSVIEAALLPSLIGWARTREMVYLGNSIGAAEALEWGLVERVVPVDELDAAVGEWVEATLAVAPRALMLQKQLIRRWENLPLDEAIEVGIAAFGEAYATDEPKRYMQRFLDGKTRNA